MTDNRVHLTPSAAERFPDLAHRAGTVVITEHAADRPAWALVAWDGGITAWMPTQDLTAAPQAPDGHTHSSGTQQQRNQP
jgi:hypothetical protein